MNWNQILEKSWRYLVRRRYLVWLGVLAALTEGGSFYSGSSGYNFSNNDLKESEKFDEILAVVTTWMRSHSLEIIIVSVALFLIGLIILYISYTARAGLIYGVNVAEEGNDSDFHRDFEAGKKYFWRFLGLRLLVIIFLVLVLVLVALAFIGAFVIIGTHSPWLIIPIILLCVPAFFGFILLAIYLSLSILIAERMIVINNLPVVEAIDQAIYLVRKKIGSVLLAWLIDVVLSLVAGIAYIIVLIFPLMIFALVCAVAYEFGKKTGLLISVPIAALVIISISAILRGIFTTYISTYWTLVYKGLIAD